LQEHAVTAKAIAELQLHLADAQVRFHSLQMSELSNTLQLQAANDSLKHLREINLSLKRYLSVERKMGRDLMAENAVLKGELEVFAETFGKQAAMLEERQEVIDGLHEKVHGMEVALKTTEGRLAEKERMRAESEAGAAVREMEKQMEQQMERQLEQQMERDVEAKSDKASSRNSLDSLVKKGGFASEKELVAYVKAREAQGRLIERLEKRVKEAEQEKKEEEKRRKQAEKKVREQKKEIDTLTKVSTKASTSRRKADTENNEEAILADDGRGKKKMVKRRVVTNTSSDPSSAKKQHGGDTLVPAAQETIDVDIAGTDDASVWNPDSARESHQETADRVEPFSDDKENPKGGLEKASVGGPGALQSSHASHSQKTTGTKRKLLSISRQNMSLLQPGGPSMLGITKKSSGFSIPKLNQKPA
jgi:hypothetical protein